MSTKRLPAYRRGDTWRILLQPITDPILQALLPLGSREVWFTVKLDGTDAVDDSDAVIQMKWPISTLPTVDVEGVEHYLLQIPSDKTNIPLAEYVADIQLVLPGSPPEVDTLVVDEKFRVTRDVTRLVEV